MLKVIILEDEKKAANMLADCIKLVAPDCIIEGEILDSREEVSLTPFL